jgi:hypothetical protein
MVLSLMAKPEHSLSRRIASNLEESGETVDVEWKIHILLQGITDLTLEAARYQGLTTAMLCATFESTVNYIAPFADQKSSKQKEQREHLTKTLNKHTFQMIGSAVKTT